MQLKELKKIIQEQVSTILNEGRYDAISGVIVDAVWKSVRDSKKDYEENPIENEVVVYNYPANFKDIKFELQIIINRIIGDNFAYRVDGASDLGFIMIKLDINPKVEPKLYNEINPKLQDVARHEIEHLNQFEGKTEKQKITPPEIRKKIQEDPSKTAEYFLLPDEIPAMVHGLYRMAKTKKIPIVDAFESYLDYFVNVENVISELDKEKIMDEWIDFAKKYIPQAKFEKSKINEFSISKTIEKTKEFGKNIGQEAKETKDAIKVLYKLIKRGKEVTPKEIEELKKQSIDVLKIITLAGIAIAPGASIALPILIKTGQKFGLNILPSSFKKK